MNCIVDGNNNIVDVSNMEVIVFGAGYYGGTVLPYILRQDNVRLKAVFDNDALKQGKMIWEERLCLSPRLIDRKMPIIIAVENAEARVHIKKQCEDLGYLYIYYLNIVELKKRVTMLPDKQYLEIQYYSRCGKVLNLSTPKSFNEKLQWLKLYDRNPQYHKLVDKYEVKKYVAEKIGAEYIIPTIGVWQGTEEIDFDRLPNQFVIKCTHDSGSTVVCRDKSKFDWGDAKSKLDFCLSRDYYPLSREWAYKNIAPRIIAEVFMQEGENLCLSDYKLMMFNGQLRCSFVCTRRNSPEGLHVTFYDSDWNIMPFERHYPREEESVPCPVSYKLMCDLAEKLSEGIPFVRVDFYEIQGRPYFGELTLYPGAGYEKFTPEEWDMILGNWLILPIH